jgi:hypothetical protein
MNSNSSLIHCPNVNNLDQLREFFLYSADEAKYGDERKIALPSKCSQMLVERVERCKYWKEAL